MTRRSPTRRRRARSDARRMVSRSIHQVVPGHPWGPVTVGRSGVGRRASAGATPGTMCALASPWLIVSAAPGGCARPTHVYQTRCDGSARGARGSPALAAVEAGKSLHAARWGLALLRRQTPQAPPGCPDGGVARSGDSARTSPVQWTRRGEPAVEGLRCRTSVVGMWPTARAATGHTGRLFGRPSVPTRATRSGI